MADIDDKEQAFWDLHAKRDPLWAILSDPSKRGRRWDLRSFMETGHREVSLLMYQLQALHIPDVVHESISWFADKGSRPWRGDVRVAGSARVETPGDAGEATVSASVLSLSDDASSEEPAPLPMHGVPRAVVETLIRQHGAALVHVEPDERCGKEWVGYRYFVRKA
jgi:hypothetical protein